MKTLFSLISVIAFTLLCSAPAFCGDSRNLASAILVFPSSDVSITVEKAESPEQRSLGLMNRSFLGEKEGMLFSFERSERLSFWMYKTLLPLNILFLDDTLKIVDILEMTPCVSTDPSTCRVYTSSKPARYAVEVNKGFAQKHRIKIGDRVRFGDRGR
jgi:uncharacterized protein